MTSIIPVIHVANEDQVMRNAAYAAKAHCDGVFLINMGSSRSIEDETSEIIGFADKIMDAHPKLLVGINHLRLDPRLALEINVNAGVDMTWTDAQPTHTLENPGIADELSSMLQGIGHDLFVGVAFKHQRPEPDPVRSAIEAGKLGFIPTTSGSATGVAADPEFITNLKTSIHDYPLAIASGITPENVALYDRYLTHILVATGISSSFHEIDPDKLDLLMKNIKRASA